MLKPQRLREGDTVAVLSPSWGGPSVFPRVYELGLQNLESLFGLKIKEYSTARRAATELYRDPKGRAEDLNKAFADPEVRAVIATIGGDDSVRVLPYLDLETILANPKILMGFSDTTTLTSYLNWHGLVTYNGPAVMAGFAQMRHLPERFVSHVREVLFEGKAVRYEPFEWWTNRYLDWSTPGYGGEVQNPTPNDEGWQWLQGSGTATGPLFGGCLDVLEFLKGTKFWPPDDFWKGRILFFETSEEKPTPAQVKYALRNYGSMGVLEKVAGILYGRARSYTLEEKQELYRVLVQVVAGEFGRSDMPIVANCDFGHTDPQWVMPLGVDVEIDCEARTLRLTEPAVGP